MSVHPVTGPSSAAVLPGRRAGGRRWRRLRARSRLWRRLMHSHPALHLTWRFTVGLVGAAVLLGGVVMCVTPGPGIGGVIVGLAILATEFSWARRLLRRARGYAARVRSQAAERIREHRARRSSPPGDAHSP
ncbi:PGPGW domain-containing protein [Thermobifida cellulosilytica]